MTFFDIFEILLTVLRYENASSHFKNRIISRKTVKCTLIGDRTVLRYGRYGTVHLVNRPKTTELIEIINMK